MAEITSSFPPWHTLPGDLVLEILKNFERRQQWKIAGICRDWRYVMLGALGKKVENVLEVLYMICALNRRRTTFKELPRPKDWQRFQDFSYTVVSLFINSDLLREHMMDDLQRMPYASRPLLPSLRDLALVHPSDCDDLYRLSISALFFHAGIRRFCLYNMPPSAAIKGRLKYRFPGLVRDIVSCAPSIKSLTLIATEDPTLEENNAFNVQIRSLIRALHDLEIVIFSPCFLTQAVFHSLSKARNLHTIIAAPARPVNHWELLPPFSAAASILFYRFLTYEQGDWESLRSYTSILSLEETTNTLAQPNFPSHQLTDLTLLATGSYNFSEETLQSFIPNGAVQSFIHTVAMQCPSLERLHIDLEAPYVLPIEDAEEPDDIPLNIANLSPLGGLDSLTEFYLHDRRLLDMTEDELVHLVRQIPRLKILYLCHTPHSLLVPVEVEVDANNAIEAAPPPPAQFEFSLPESPFGMRVVSRIMEALPGLKELGIYLDISDDILPVHRGRASLDVLHVGNSPPPPLTLPSDAFLPYLSRQGKLVVGPQQAYRWGYPGPDMIQDWDQFLAEWSRFTSYSKSIYEVTMSVEALHPLF